MIASDLKARAEGGDAAAQYALAAALDDAGRPQEAAPWLEKAAAAGHPGAAYTKATQLLHRPSDGAAVANAVRLLETAAAKGGLAAARQLAVLKALGLGAPEDWAGATAHLRKAAAGGHPAALRALAALGRFCGAADGSVRRLLRAAALKGDAAAAILALRDGGTFSHDEAEALRSKFAEWPLIDRPSEDYTSAAAPTAKDVEACAAAALTFPALSPLRIALHDDAPRIVSLENLLPRLLADYVVLAAATLLAPSAVVDSMKGRAAHAEFRTSDGCAFGVVDLDVALCAIHRALAGACGMDVASSELMGVLRYRPGEEYRPHYDFLPADAADYSEIERAGQRVATLLVTLDDAFEGGATQFPKLGVAWRGAVGNGLFFRNADGAGRPYPDSLHAGAPVTGGEKWMLTLWFRARRFWPWDKT